MITTSPDGAGRQVLLHVSQKHVDVHRAVNHQWHRDAGRSQRTDEGCRLPMSGGNFADHPFASKCLAVVASHLGVDADFVKEDQTKRMQLSLPKLPQPAAFGHVGTAIKESL